MTEIIDLSTDILADAPLAPEQKVAWTSIREELMSARKQIHEMEVQIKSLRQTIGDETSDRTILNRPEFNREVARMLAFDERYGGLSSILYIDFENLEEITQNYGNALSSAAMKVVCDTLSKQVRTSDILGRLAPNEFGILLVRCDNSFAWKKGETLVEKLQQALSDIQGNKINPIISYGAYTFRENEDVAGGIKHAAEAITIGQGH